MNKSKIALILKLFIMDFIAASLVLLVAYLLFPDKVLFQWIGVALSIGIATAIVMFKHRKSGKGEA